AIAAQKAECRARILAVVDETAQLNLTAAAAAGFLSAEDMATYLAGVAWIAAMRAAWPTVPAAWPAPPAGLTALAARF
ncbi:MAG: hypothetical protein IE927_06960, partial [Rhodobacterales bacterium]|nr:hypothetical protein [Rhodobacterales bacterium]